MSKPWLPRFQLFEIDDQSWWPSNLRTAVQSNLSHIWTTSIPPFIPIPVATLTADILREILLEVEVEGRRRAKTKYNNNDTRHCHNNNNNNNIVVVDFCSGSGGPTPSIEREVNNYRHSSGKKKNEYYDDHSSEEEGGRVEFILTDLHPDVGSWEKEVRKGRGKVRHLWYVPRGVDASDAPEVGELLGWSTFNDDDDGGAGDTEEKKKKKKLFRTFHLSFHHFDDELARKILRNTVETSEGIAIFELQSRDLWSFIPCLLSGFFAIFTAPLHFFFLSPSLPSSIIPLLLTSVIPLIPFVLAFDGFVSCLRTRTPEEIEHLLRTCGAFTEKGEEEEEEERWTVTSGRRRFLWPCGFLNWVVCTKRTPTPTWTPEGEWEGEE